MSSHNDHAAPVDPVTGMATTGHSWDGISELNTPLPRWWLWIFYATIVWSVGYFVVYPSWPLAQSFTQGIWNWSSRAAVSAEITPPFEVVISSLALNPRSLRSACRRPR